MKILMQGRLGLFGTGGGDKVQIEHTASELRKLGVAVDMADDFVEDLSPYDLVHIFQLDWTPETYFYAKKVEAVNKPLVLSPIHHAVSEVKKFDDTYVFGLRRLSKLLFKDQHHRDTFKNVYRSLFDSQKLGPTLKSVFIGLERMHARTLSMADMVLVQTQLEAADLKSTYGVDFIWEKIPNGVGEHFLNPTKFENTLGFGDYIICVGRIEPRKNQINIIKAVDMFRNDHNLDVKLLFVGAKSTSHAEYIYRFKHLLKSRPWVICSGYVPHENMPAYYHFAKVGISASWFETTGLTSLEALFCGTNAVAAGERAREYLGAAVSYCKPGSILSIKEALEHEYFAKRPVIDAAMRSEYTWQNAAQKTYDVYKKILCS